MKIVFTIAHMNLGGAQRVCYNLINWIIYNTDAEVHLMICSGRTIKKEYDLSKIPYTIVSGGLYNKISRIRSELKRINPDVLVTMGVPGALFDVPACVGLGIKHIISERNDPAHFAGSTITRIVSRLLMQKADGFVFQTKDAQNYYGGNIAKHSTIIPNPLFISGDLTDVIYKREREKVIVATGRLNKQKNHPLLIKAFKRVHEKYPEYKLVIYGEGPERERDEALIKELKIEDCVSLPGAINNVPEIIRKASLYVLSSNFEGMPNALMEAMALGLPSISTDCPCGGPRELIRNGENGMLVPVGDEKALSEAMLYMLEHPDEANAMGQEAMKIRETHSTDRICQQWYDYFQKITG